MSPPDLRIIRVSFAEHILKDQEIPMRSRGLVVCAFLLIAALYVVGIDSHGVLRHFVQTLPVWAAVVLGVKGSQWSKWVALPCFAVWLLLMSLIWMFLLGWTRVISGTFPPLQFAMTLIVGACAAIGIVLAVRMKTGLRALPASAGFVGMLILQIIALRISFLPGIAHD
jgi:hypothetical protein